MALLQSACRSRYETWLFYMITGRRVILDESQSKTFHGRTRHVCREPRLSQLV
ncbi:hypothetical protein SERLADRAFT_394798, partial [Serpula lacrymans var. lacrymans S7.9]